jgi:hypothetical protein
MTCKPSNGVTVVAVEPRDPTADDDKTKIRVVPISVTDDDSTVLLEGMFFDDWSGWTEEDEPEQALTIEKDVLDRSSGYIIGRFSFDIAARAKIVFRASLDGKVIDDYGTGLPYGIGEGDYDTTLFNYNDVPNTAKANKDGVHKVHVDYALITGIAESQLGLLEWGEMTAKGTADFTITLLPHKIQD